MIDARAASDLEAALGFRLQPGIVNMFPLRTNNVLVGILVIESPRLLPGECVDALTALSNEVALAVESARLTADLRRDIERREMLEAQLVQQAFHDGLTGLPNRRLLSDRLEAAIRRGDAFAVCILDLDGFKEVNDAFGHDVGDLLLGEVATRLSSGVRSTDLVARLGGDEFALLLEGVDATAALTVAEHLLATLAPGFEIGGQGIDVSASIGISQYPGDGQDLVTLMRRADVAMYAAKRSKSGQVAYAPKLDQGDVERLALLRDLRRPGRTVERAQASPIA